MTFHKHSRDEHANTIRDLLDVNFDAKGPTGLPEDPDWHGFERIGAAMTLSPFHVESISRQRMPFSVRLCPFARSRSGRRSTDAMGHALE